MRTNVEIDDQLMRDALELAGLGSKRATVEEGLRLLVRVSAGRRLIELAGEVEFLEGYDALDDADPDPPAW
jgi:Arc/MetJ family transcription regulator